jgi:hypothetical protein
VPATDSEDNKDLLNKQSKNTVVVSESVKRSIVEVTRNACHRLQCKLQYDVFKKAELESNHKFPERRFERSEAVHD